MVGWFPVPNLALCRSQMRMPYKRHYKGSSTHTCLTWGTTRRNSTYKCLTWGITPNSRTLEGGLQYIENIVQLLHMFCLYKHTPINSTLAFTLSCKALDHFNHILMHALLVLTIYIALCAPMAPFITAFTVPQFTESKSFAICVELHSSS